MTEFTVNMALILFTWSDSGVCVWITKLHVTQSVESPHFEQNWTSKRLFLAKLYLLLQKKTIFRRDFHDPVVQKLCLRTENCGQEIVRKKVVSKVVCQNIRRNLTLGQCKLRKLDAIWGSQRNIPTRVCFAKERRQFLLPFSKKSYELRMKIVAMSLRVTLLTVHSLPL